MTVTTKCTGFATWPQNTWARDNSVRVEPGVTKRAVAARQKMIVT